MTFTQVLSQCMKEAIYGWDQLPPIDKWAMVGLAVGILLLITSLWLVL